MEICNLNSVGLESCVERAVGVLRLGGVIIYPTDTIYGAGVDAGNELAVSKLLKFKNQPHGSPIPIIVDCVDLASEYVFLDTQSESLFKTLLPGPFTIVMKSRHRVDLRLESVHGTLGVRMIDLPVVVQIIGNFGKAITTTSALPAYKKRPYSVDDIINNLSEHQKGLVDLIIDVGLLPHKKPSTVIDTTVGRLQVLRQGQVNFSDVETFNSFCVEDTVRMGEMLMKEYLPYVGYKPIIIAMSGEMGAGKTHTVKGFAAALGLEDEMTSPTYSILNEYQLSSFNDLPAVRFYHADLWRVKDIEDIESLGFFELIKKPNIMAIEWADPILYCLDALHHDAIIIHLEIEFIDDNTRKITKKQKE